MVLNVPLNDSNGICQFRGYAQHKSLVRQYKIALCVGVHFVFASQVFVTKIDLLSAVLRPQLILTSYP